MFHVWIHFGDLFGNVFRQEQLPRVRNVSAGIAFSAGTSAQTHLQVNMDGASGVPTGIDGRKLRDALAIGDLNAAQKSRFIDGTLTSPTARPTGPPRPGPPLQPMAPAGGPNPRPPSSPPPLAVNPE